METGKFVQINPTVPRVTPENFVLPEGDVLTKIKFLARVEESRNGGWRCHCCSEMQPEGALQVWMEDSIMRHDPAWSIYERNKRSAWNGNFSAWCFKCVEACLPKVPRETNAVPVPIVTSRFTRVWSWMKSKLTR